MTSYEIPLSPEPQKFSIQLAGVQRKMRFYWCRFSACWMFDLFDVKDVPLLQGCPVVTGTNLLGQHKHLALGGSIVAQSDFDPDAVPTFDNLGVTGRVYFIVE